MVASLSRQRAGGRRQTCVGRYVVAASLALLVALSAQADGLNVSGRWQGEVKPDPRLPVIPWQVELQTKIGGVLAAGTHVALTAELPSGPVHIEVDQAAGAESWRWHLAPHRLPLTSLKPVATRFESRVGEWELSGEIEVEGEGTWVDGDAAGELRFAWRPDRLSWTGEDVVILGLELTGTVTVRATAIAEVNVDLSWRELRSGPVVVTQGTLHARGGGDGRWQVGAVTAGLWGGQVVTEPFEFVMATPGIKTRVTLEGVAAAELAEFVPTALSSATGRVSGNVIVGWTPDGGVVPGAGSVRFVDAESSVVSLAASPGLLSGNMPARFEFLPAWMGPLAKWATVENPAQSELVEIEMGRKSLRVESMEVVLYPDGPEGARSVMVRLKARPLNAKAVEFVDFTVNVSGPLDQVIQLGMNDKATFTMRP